MSEPDLPASAPHDDQSTVAAAPDKPSAWIGRRLLSLFYDMWPMVAVWMLFSLVFTALYQAAGHGTRETLPQYGLLQWLLWLCCWCVTGVYAVASWSRGGQTLGMRPWRLRVIADDGGTPARKALLLRYLVGACSLLLGGLGFWWAWFDRDKRTWHDRASGTRVVRMAKR